MSNVKHENHMNLKMMSVTSIDQHVVMTYGKLVFVFQQHDDLQKPIFNLEHDSCITYGTYLPKNNFLMFTDVNKKLFIYNVSTKSLVSSKFVIKRAAKIIYTNDESTLLIADKTGDVYTMDMNNIETSEVKLLMGHLSMITDLKLTKDEKHLITSDRDEKIRISCFPNSYNINSYLLGHKEFVSQIEFIDETRLVSSSGDSKLILWDLQSSQIIQEIHTTTLIPKDETNKFESKGISWFHFKSDKNELLIHLFGSKFVLSFEYSKNDLKLKFKSIVNFGLDANVTRIEYISYLYDNYYLYICGKKFKVAMISNSVLNKPTVMGDFTTYLNENIKLDEIQNEIDENYNSFFKNIIYDNVDLYYEKKNERIMTALQKKTNDN